MPNRELVRNHLKLADETCESFKGAAADTTFKERVWMSFALLVTRAICAALLAIADAIYDHR
jgi:hypothetical protein